jgi:hypothetical protein
MKNGKSMEAKKMTTISRTEFQEELQKFPMTILTSLNSRLELLMQRTLPFLTIVVDLVEAVAQGKLKTTFLRLLQASCLNTPNDLIRIIK